MVMISEGNESMLKELQYFYTDLIQNQDINAPIDQKPLPGDIVKDPIREFEQRLLTTLQEKRNGTLYLYGDYGTGKTFVLNYYYSVLDEEWKGEYEKEKDFVLMEKRIIPFKIDLNAIRSPISLINHLKERIEEKIGHELDDIETIKILFKGAQKKHGWSSEQIDLWIEDALTKKNPLLGIKISIEDESSFRESMSALLEYIRNHGYDGILFLFDEGELRYIADERRTGVYQELDSLFRYMLPFLEGLDNPKYYGFYAVLAITPLTGSASPEILSERGRAQQVFKLDEVSDTVFINMCKMKLSRLIENRRKKPLPSEYFPFDEEIVEYLASDKCPFLPLHNIRAVLKAMRILLDTWNNSEADTIDYTLLWEALPELPKAAIFEAKTFQEDKLEDVRRRLDSFDGFKTSVAAQDAFELFKQLFPKREPVSIEYLQIGGERINSRQVIEPLKAFCQERVSIFDFDLENNLIQINEDFRRSLFLEKEKVDAVEYANYLLSSYCGDFTHMNGLETMMSNIKEIIERELTSINGRDCIRVKSKPKHYPAIDAYVFIDKIQSEVKASVLKDFNSKNLPGGFVIIQESKDKEGVEFTYGCELDLRRSKKDISGILRNRIEAGRYRDRYPGDTAIEKIQNVLRLFKVREHDDEEQRTQQEKETSESRIRLREGLRKDLYSLMDSMSGLLRSSLNDISKKQLFEKIFEDYEVSSDYDADSFEVAPQIFKEVMRLRRQGKKLNKSDLDNIKNELPRLDLKVKEEGMKILENLSLIFYIAGQPNVANRPEKSPCLKKIYGILKSMNKNDLSYKTLAPKKLLQSALWLESTQGTGMKKYRLMVRSFVDLLEVYGIVLKKDVNGEWVLIIDPQEEYIKEIEELIQQYKIVLSYKLIEEPETYIENLEGLRLINKQCTKEAKTESSPERAGRLRELKEKLEEKYLTELADFDLDQQGTTANRFKENIDTLNKKVDEIKRRITSFRSDAEDKNQLDKFVDLLDQWRSFFEGKLPQAG